VVNLDWMRRPVRALDRIAGPFPYYGASGIVDHVDEYLFDGLHLLVAEDGENLRTRKTPIAFLAAGRFWVNNHAHVMRGNDDNDTRFLSYVVEMLDISGYLTGSTQPKLTQHALGGIPVEAPPLFEQRSVAATLGALDDKIESNRRIIASCRALAGAHYALAGGDGLLPHCVGDVVTFHNRRRVPLSMQERAAMPGDVPYYGATGVVAHVAKALFDHKLVLVGEDGSVVRPDGSPFLQYVWGAAWVNNHAHVLTGSGMSTELLLLALERADVRPLVTGAAQPKLSMGNLKSLMVFLPAAESLARLEAEIAPLFDVLRQRCDEIERLAALRDALLPELLSGRIRVPEAGTDLI
jgi:type I restriction enzyme S subunit